MLCVGQVCQDSDNATADTGPHAARPGLQQPIHHPLFKSLPSCLSRCTPCPRPAVLTTALHCDVALKLLIEVLLPKLSQNHRLGHRSWMALPNSLTNPLREGCKPNLPVLHCMSDTSSRPRRPQASRAPCASPLPATRSNIYAPGSQAESGPCARLGPDTWDIRLDAGGVAWHDDWCPPLQAATPFDPTAPLYLYAGAACSFAACPSAEAAWQEVLTRRGGVQNKWLMQSTQSFWLGAGPGLAVGGGAGELLIEGSACKLAGSSAGGGWLWAVERECCGADGSVWERLELQWGPSYTPTELNVPSGGGAAVPAAAADPFGGVSVGGFSADASASPLAG